MRILYIFHIILVEDHENSDSDSDSDGDDNSE